MPTPEIESLSGPWRAIDLGLALAPGSEDAADPVDAHLLAAVDVDDSGWAELPVPGHWRSHPEFATSDGPVLFRRRVLLDRAEPEDRVFLVLHGVMAVGDVWFDGTYLGDIRGFAIPHTFEITGLLPDAPAEHVVAIEAGFQPVGTGRVRDLSGAFGRSALLGSGTNPGGIWRDVEVRTTGPVRIDHCRLRCTEASPDRAVLALRLVLDADRAGPATIRTWVRRVEDQLSLLGPDEGAPITIDHTHTLAAGENRVELEIEIPEPALWWPRSLGDQPLYDVGADIAIDGRTSDSHRWRTGLRTVAMDDLITTVNGQRMFLKGISLGPTRLHIAEASSAEVAADIAMVADAGLDLVRVHGHLARPELYEEADRRGILIWQDLPIQWALLRQTKPAARRMARSMVDQLAHHPSILLWNAHHEPWAGDPASWRSGDAARRRRMRIRMAFAQLLPSWNRTLLDRSVADTLRASDPTRPVLTQSGSRPHLTQLTSGATHLWVGWRWGRIHDLARLLRWWPRLGGFVAEFGAQAPIDTVTVEHLARQERAGSVWPRLPWPELAERSALELPALKDQVPPAGFTSAEAWVAALQAHQRELVVSHVETLRRLKYRPTGGFAAFALAEPGPGITAALLDHRRRPKPAWAGFVAACAPVIAVLEAPPPELRTDDRLGLAIHLVNDRRTALDDLTVTVTIAWDHEPERVVHRAGWTGRIGPDEVTRVGMLRVTVPQADRDGDLLRLTVRLTGPDIDTHERIHHRRVRR